MALVWFWLGTAPGWATSNIVTKPLLPEGWIGVLGAVPFALWFLVIIETVALAPEEVEEPRRSIPVGMTLGQLTLIVLVVFTVLTTAAAYSNFGEDGSGGSLFPLSFVFNEVHPGSPLFVLAFGTLAVSGMIVSYNGMIYATSRQSYSLGRAGYFPQVLGSVHPTRRTPVASLALWSAVSIAFIIWGYWNATATATAILISTLTALVWYVLAVGCLFVLRRREPNLPRPYRVPVFPLMPVFVALLSVFAAYYYVFYNRSIIWWTLGLYALAAVYFLVYGRHQVQEHAPEEVAARIAQELDRERGAALAGSPATTGAGEGPRAWTGLEWLAAGTLSVTTVALIWLLLMAYDVIAEDVIPIGGAITLLIVVLGAALLSVAAVALIQMGKAAPVSEEKPVSPAPGDTRTSDAVT